MDSNSSGSNKEEIRGSRGAKIADKGRSGGLQPGGPPGSPDAHCISISSDSESSDKDTGAPAPRVLQLSGKSSSASSKQGPTDNVLFLIDSDDDSDYKQDLLALADSENESYGGRGGSIRPSTSSQAPLVGVSSAGEAVNEVAAQFDFPCIYSLFAEYNDSFFEGRLSHVEVKWSSRMTLCAGLCVYRTGGYCSVRLSAPLLRYRSIKELKETLLHEMIHAFLFVTEKNRSHNAHGPPFLALMKRLNEKTGLNITVFHNFHDEVNHYRRHVWRCEGPCRERPPYFGFIRRAMNRSPGPNDWWWAEHKETCNGIFVKVSEPRKTEEQRKAVSTPKKDSRSVVSQATSSSSSSAGGSSSSCNGGGSSSSNTKGSAGIKRHFSLEDDNAYNPKRIKKVKLQRSQIGEQRSPRKVVEVFDLEQTSEERRSKDESVNVAAKLPVHGRSVSAAAAAERRAAAAEKRAEAAAAAAVAEGASAVEAVTAAPTDANTQTHSSVETKRYPAASAPAELAACPRCHCHVEAATLRRHIQCCIRDHPLSHP